MKLICLACGNYVHFQADVEGLRSVIPGSEGIMIEDAVFDDWNWSDSTLRDNLQDVVDWVLKCSDEALSFDADSGHYINTYITCARCGSKRVTPPYSKWQPPRNLKSLEQELLENQAEFKLLRREKIYANQLPRLWEP